MNEKHLPSLRKLWLKLPNCMLFDTTNWTTPGDPRFGEVCRMGPLTTFLQGLDQPNLELLEIKLPVVTGGSEFLDIVSTVVSSCRLRNLEVLSFPSIYNEHPGTRISPAEFPKGLSMLLPLPQLKVLQLSVAPNFLDIFDLDLYKSFAKGLPALQKLLLGHYSFVTSSPDRETVYRERVPLHHLAAFCSMSPNLVETSLGCVDVEGLDDSP